MPIVSQTPSHDFRYSLQLLKQLHFLHQCGDDEGSEADDTREAAADLWWKLSQAEQQRLEGLSADLYSIGEDRQVISNVSDEVAKSFRTATEAEDWDEALAVLRQHEKELPPRDVAAMRGVAWGTLGQQDVASLFFAEACRLEPRDIRFKCLYLRSLVRSGELAEAKAKAVEFATTAGDDPIELLLAADVLLDSGGNEPTLEVLRQVADLASRGFESLEPHGLSEESSRIAGAGLLSGAISLERLGKRDQVRKMLGMAEILLPAAAALKDAWPSESPEPSIGVVNALVRAKKDIDDALLASR